MGINGTELTILCRIQAYPVPHQPVVYKYFGGVCKIYFSDLHIQMYALLIGGKHNPLNR